jgi:outer membrane receptor protein involved in Fe transport
MKGLRVGGGFTYNHNVRDYYYLSPTGQRTLFLSPNRLSTNLMIGYTRKLARGISWSVQLNVSNVFDAQSTIFLPNAATGVIDNARLAQNPRLFRLSTTFDF